jgi:hypothetical protein
MELRHLRYFAAVVQCKGYREASRASVSVPASAERRLAELGIELTPAPTPFGAYVLQLKPEEAGALASSLYEVA